MKRSILFLSLLLLSCERGPFFEPLEPKELKLSNGMELLLLPDPEFPTVEIFLFIRGGSVYDPPGKEGLASVAMQALRLGGTPTRRPDEIDEALDFVGASLEMGTTAEYHTATLTLMKKDLDLGLDILCDLLRRPALAPDRFEIAKKKAKESLLRREEDPLSLGYLEYPRFVYGGEIPWGRRPTVASLDRLTREDVVAFHRDSFQPDRMFLAAAGDFPVKEFATALEARMGDWRSAGKELPPIPPVEERFERERVLIPREGLQQTTILIGHLGGRRDNPDKFPLVVMNFLLGGGGSLTSRLGEEIRSSAGKAYAVWSDYGFGRDLGLFRAVAQTSGENTEWTVGRMEALIEQMARRPEVTEEELMRAKRALLWSLFFDLETSSAQVRQQAIFRLWGYPKDYLKSYQREIARVTRADVERVARAYLHPDGLKVLLIANPALPRQGLLKGIEIRRVP